MEILRSCNCATFTPSTISSELKELVKHALSWRVIVASNSDSLASRLVLFPLTAALQLVNREGNRYELQLLCCTNPRLLFKMQRSFVLIIVHGITFPEIGRSETPNPSQVRRFFESTFDSSDTPCHVHEFQYPGDSFHRNPGYRDIRAQAKHVLDCLARWNYAECPKDAPFIFIGHDLGGLFIKQLLLTATEVPKYHEIVLKTQGLIFVGTPHNIESNSAWELELLRILSISELGSQNLFEVAQAMSNTLAKLIIESSFVFRNFNVLNLYQKATGDGAFKPTVSENVASLDLPRERNIGIKCGHRELWEFGSDDDKSDLICQRLRATVKANGSSSNLPQTQMLKFIGALSSFNTGPNRLRLIEDEPNFVNWITGDPSYKDWKEKQQPIILHLRGSLGSGTTMAARHILRSLWRSTRSANAIVTSFSFNDHDSEARTIMSLLVSLCRQVLLARPKIFLHIMSLTEFLLEERIFTERTLWSVLHLLIQHLPATAFYCVMHSIHYCENPDKLDRILREFSEIAPRLVPGKLKILITSNIPYQLPVFTAASDAYTVIRLDENAHINAAIENTVRGRLRSIPQEIPISESLVEEIVRVCTRQKNYLLSTRKVDILKSLTTLSTESNIEESLRSLPKTLEKSHEHFIGDFKSKWVRTALLSISHASRPLNAEELSVIVALDKYDGTSLSTLTKNLPSNIYGDLIRAAGSLIKVIDGRIFPFHRSMWNILSKMTAKWGDNPHAVLLEKCIGYLRLRKRHKADISSQVELTVLESFSQYATVHWPDHFARTHLKKARAGATENALNFLRDRTMAASWAGDYNNYVGPIGKSSITLDTHPKIACYFGLADRLLVTFIRNRESNPDFMTEAEEALDLAAGEGHKQKVSILLRANVFSPNALGRAAVGGHLPVIKELLENEKFDPDLPDTKGYTPLHYASCAGHENVSIYLLSRWWTIGGDNWVKGNIEALTDPGGYTPLHLATRTGQLKTIRRLISAGAVVAAEDHQGRSCLHLAAQAGFTDIVKFLIEKHRLGTEKTDKEGNTALHWAVEYGHLSTVRTLLDFSQGCNRVNNADATPLRLAAENNHLDILQLLLRYEQERNKSPDGSYDIHTGKHRAEKGNGTFNEHEVPSSWFDAKQVETPLQVASRKGHIEIVSCLLKSDIITGHNGDRDSSIALFLAAEQGHSAIVEELLTHGAGTKMTNVLGNTPLHVAAEGGHYTVIQTLVKRSGPDGIDKANHDGWTPLHKAAYQGSLRLVKFLIEEGASIEPETRASDTPVKIAAQQGHPKVTSYLFTKAMERKKGDLYPRMRIFRRIRTVKWPGSMKNGREAFDNAVVNGHPAVAEALLQAGLELELPLQLKNLLKYATVLKEAPDSWITRSYNKGTKLSTALHLAVRKGYVSSVEYLLGKVNDIHSRDGRGKTPLQIAVLKDDPELCKTILSYCASHKAWPLYEQHRSAVSLSSEDSVTTTDEEISDAERNIWVSTTATPLFLACYHTKENAAKAILEWFKDKEADDTQCHLKLDEVDEETGWAPLHAAADNGNITRILLNAGANPNCKTTNTQATPLAMAAYPNICLDVVTILLAHPECELNPQDRDGGTPLHRAVSGESLSIVKKLASKEVRFDIARNDGCTPLHLAVATGQTEIVKFFVQKRVQVNTTSKAYGTSLTAAVRGGRPEIVQILLKQGVNVNASIGRHPTPLQAAAKLGDLDMIKILLEHGASVDKSGKSGETPLVAAIDGGKEEAALLLWDNGADLDTKDRHGNSLLQLIAKMGSSRMLDRLLHDKPGVQLDCQDGTMNTPLCTAIIHGHEDVALKLLLADPNVNSHSNNACSPLFFAVQYFQSNIVSKLVEKGAYDPAALEMAIRKGYPDLVFSIRRNAKDFNPLGRAPGGASWLWLTVLGGRVEILDALVETDKLPPEDANGKLLLLLAVSRQDTKMVEALLQRRHAPIIEKDSSNRNALILDVLHGSNCLKLLLEGWKKTTAATEIDVRDDEGKTALICACMKSDMKAVSQLLTSGAEPSITDGRKRGPLYWACRRGSEAIFDLIVKKLDARRDPISIKEKINGVGDQGSQYASGLFGAIASNEASLVQRLIETKRIPLDVRDDDGWTPVETARQFGLNFMESQLLAAGFPEEISTQTTDRDKPLEWSSVDRHGSLVVEDGVDVVVKKTSCEYMALGLRDLYAVIRGNTPLRAPPGESVCYFEVTIEENVKPWSWAIGFCEDTAPLGRMIGWSEGSWGYHGDDGAVYGEGNFRYIDSYGYDSKGYGVREVIGCGINFEKKIAFFTRNGTEIGTLFTGVEGKLYPAVSVDIKMIGSRVSTKFWNTRKEDFAFQNDLTSPETFKLPVLSRSPIPILAGPGESDRDSDDISMKEEES